jgi:hypothetical protein
MPLRHVRANGHAERSGVAAIKLPQRLMSQGLAIAGTHVPEVPEKKLKASAVRSPSLNATNLVPNWGSAFRNASIVIRSGTLAANFGVDHGPAGGIPVGIIKPNPLSPHEGPASGICKLLNG